MTASVNDKITKTFNSTNPNVARVTATRSAAGTTLTCDNLAGWPDDTGVHLSTYRVASDGTTVSYQIDWKGVVSGNTITALTRKAGAADAGSAINDYVEMNPTANWANDLAEALLQEHDPDGTHKNITSDTITTTGDVEIGGSLIIAGSSSDGGWSPISGAISAVTYNGNHSYSLTTAADNTASISAGMRLRTTRTVSAPIQCADLESSSSQYYSKTSPNKLSFTDDYTVMGWVKLESYTAGGIIARRNADTEGWSLSVNSSGQVLAGSYRIASNNSVTTSYQSLPLGKWVHVAATTDLSGTSVLIYIDGVLVTSATVITGTITALVQGTTALVVGAEKSAGTNPFDGKIAQVAVFSTVLTAATIRSYISQGLAGNETSLQSAYSLSNSITDLNTTTPNDLTPQGSAVATNADSPFGGQASGSISSSLDYGIVQKITSTTITLQVPEGCTIPTSGGVSAASYAYVKAPYGFPSQESKWWLEAIHKFQTEQTTPTQNTWYNSTVGSLQLTIPIGAWVHGYELAFGGYKTSATGLDVYSTLSTANNSESDPEMTSWAVAEGATGTMSARATTARFKPVDVTTQAAYYFNVKSATASASTIATYGSQFPAKVFAKNAYL